MLAAAPIGLAGRRSCRPRCALQRPARGFTLVEVLVVVALIAIATAASLSYLRPPAADAAQEGRRLAVVLERLGLEARLSGRRMAWRCEGARLVFESWESEAVAAAGAWQPWPGLPPARLADGLHFGELTLDGRRADCAARVVLPVFGTASEFSLEIVAAEAGADRRISGDAAGRVTLLEVVSK